MLQIFPAREGFVPKRNEGGGEGEGLFES